MRKLGQTISHARALSAPLVDAASIDKSVRRVRISRSDHLTELTGFGSNPGALRMFTYVPKKLESSPALVVVLHGCTQSAASYDLGAGWSTLAERYGFVLLLPEQTAANNPKTCFNWFLPDRHRARSWRGAVDPPDDREDDRRPQRRPRPRIHHRPLGRRRDDGGHARHLSGGLCGRRDHRGSAIWRGRKCPASLRKHVSGPRTRPRKNGATWCAALRGIAGDGRACLCGTATPTQPWCR